MVSLLRLTTSFVHSFQSAGDFHGLLADLSFVTSTSGHTQSSVRGGIAFNCCIGQDGRCESIGLPFVIGSGCFALTDGRHERRVGGGDGIDHIGQIFALTDGGIGLVGCHD